jgi:hypothetical protein
VIDADRIVVLRGGRVEAVGTHAQLLAQGGYYAGLFAHHERGHPDAVPARPRRATGLRGPTHARHLRSRG